MTKKAQLEAFARSVGRPFFVDEAKAAYGTTSTQANQVCCSILRGIGCVLKEPGPRGGQESDNAVYAYDPKEEEKIIRRREECASRKLAEVMKHKEFWSKF